MTETEKEERRKMTKLSRDEAHDVVTIARDMEHWLRGNRRRFFLLVALGLVVLGVLTVISVGVVKNVNRIDRAQGLDAANARRGSYRGCVRNDVTRAELQLASGQRGEKAILRARRARLPVLDCSPVLRDRNAVPKPLRDGEQGAYVRYYGATCRAPVVRGGKVTSKPDPADGQLSRGCLGG